MSLDAHAADLATSLAKADLVPGSAATLIPDGFRPTTQLGVRFAGKDVELGTFLRAGECKQAPTLTFAPEASASADATYSFILTDPDAPTPDDPKFAFWRHWVLSGLRPQSTDANAATAVGASELTAYLGPGPKDDSKPHRYLFLLYREPKGLRLSKTDVGGEEFVQRRSFKPAEFAERNGLSLVGVNWMYCAGKLDPYLDTDASEPGEVVDIICQICRHRPLTISPRARPFILEGSVEPLDQLVNMFIHGFEQTALLPCGHVFGARCLRQEYSGQRHLVCPSCGFQMTYASCGHAIPPAIVPINSAGSVRDTFPLTIPEGGLKPSHCKECRWRAIRIKLRHALNSECVICMERKEAGREHNVHYARHVECGIKDVLSQVMMLVQPDFVTRTTADSVRKAREETDRRDVNTALLYAMVLTELESTMWRETATNRLTSEQRRRHAAGVNAIESYILELLMLSGNTCRRMW
ncbi:PEBP-like protein [Nemania sp. FL0916]|nr:PEBP-like protein [Nemania sp. FL0916]